MTLFQITTAIRATQGEVILCGPTTFGFVVRASLGDKALRIINPSSKKSLKILPETGVETHIVTDVQSLQHWLKQLKSTSPAQLIIA